MNIQVKSFLLAGIMLAGSIPGWAGEDDYLKPVGKPPVAKAQRRQGGEAFPPLPLPVTPLRRSEKKRPPSPTALIGKVVWGSYLDYTWENGITARVFDWNMVPADCQQLLRMVKQYTKMEYKTQTVDLASFSGNPSEIPVLFFSGGRTVKFTPQERAKLRKYLLDGGTLWFDSVVGSPYFYRGAVQEMQTILPESPLKKLPPDHPAFRMVKTVNAVKLNDGTTVAPALDGAYIGARLAVVVSPYGMGGGWDDVYPALIADAKYYQRQGAAEIGVNLAAYTIGWFENGRAYAEGEAYGGGDRVASPDKVVFAQIKTNGLWNSDPGAETRFMRYLAKNVNIDAGSEPVYVDPEKTPVDDYPFLYLSGIGGFQLSAEAVRKLRGYLDNGGFLLVNNSLGMNEFDVSCCQLLRQLYPGSAPEMVSAKDALLANGPYKFTQSGFSDVAAQKYPGMSHPLLYGVKDGNRYKLVYSPVDIAGGGLATPRPGSSGYDPETANRLGTNIITYFLTH